MKRMLAVVCLCMMLMTLPGCQTTQSQESLQASSDSKIVEDLQSGESLQTEESESKEESQALEESRVDAPGEDNSVDDPPEEEESKEDPKEESKEDPKEEGPKEDPKEEGPKEDLEDDSWVGGEIPPSLNTDVELLFAQDLYSRLPKPIGQESKDRLLSELQEVLFEKQYGEHAERMICAGMEYAMEYYVNFETMFAFLEVPDAETYLRNYFIRPLEIMVDSVVVTDQGGQGSANDYHKILTICESDNPYADAVVLVHELWHMAVSIEHRTVDGGLYMTLNEGGACLMQLILAGSPYYWNVGDVRTGGSGAIDLENSEVHMMISHFGSMQYSQYFGVWYKLFTLTDFDTMALFLKTKGEHLIRENLVSRYGEDGGRVFDLLLGYVRKENIVSCYDALVEMESLYLRLLKGRLTEVDSPEEMMEFMQMYRVTRLALGSDHYSHRTVCTEESGCVGYEQLVVHPDLDYMGLDRAVAKAICHWNVLNADAMAEEQEYALAYSLMTFPDSTTEDEYKATRKNVDKCDPLLLPIVSYSMTTLGDGTTVQFDFYYPWENAPVGSQAYYEQLDYPMFFRIFDYETGNCFNYKK